MSDTVLRLSDIHAEDIKDLLGRYHLQLQPVELNKPIPGSWFGDEEAGVINNTIYARVDTPIHSILHESCHFICMDEKRRNNLDTNAQGDYDEENAVCYLQIILADQLQNMDQNRMMLDMDRWGYSFRLGSAEEWFESDASEARDWLIDNFIISVDGKPTFKLHH